jgi:hypothetical protein
MARGRASDRVSTVVDPLVQALRAKISSVERRLRRGERVGATLQLFVEAEGVAQQLRDVVSLTGDTLPPHLAVSIQREIEALAAVRVRLRNRA